MAIEQGNCLVATEESGSGDECYIESRSGFITKISPTLKGRSFRAKFMALCMGMINSMFIAYISYEILLSLIDKQGLAVALAGMAAFTGTDLLIITQNKIIELIKRKMDTI